MGTWDVGPFDNDTAADFAGRLDDLPEQERPAAIRAVLTAVLAEQDYLDSDYAVEAVAAAALIAAQCPGGRPVDSAYGPDKPVPELPADLRPLAVQAIDRILGEDSELQQLWDDGGVNRAWHDEMDGLRAVLAKAS
ncbi:protein of unknown function [Thermomonospora echinospora]|uniref:DUF4259 domain-containing protein n=1 Tax=Thermomonospora echinospora TaxID=1992 RepID=A0A1H5VKJ5_9ACTN|nr:DUF4259 domain-containing protein [Thermomonospora echinospora]SEF87361.1 protein of unknown function [Thermomonospora echinospora]